MRGRAILALLACGAAGVLADEVKVPVVPVAKTEFRRSLTYPGRVTPVAQVHVVAQVAGEILEVGFENGDVVREGALLYRLDPVKYEAAVKNAEAKVAECKANLSYAELSYTRHKKLVSTHAVSLDAVDNALSARDSARAALAAAQADLEVARDDLKHCRIVAPHSGKLGSTAFTRGNYVQTSSGTLVTLIQMAPIRVRFAMSNAEFLDMFGGRNRKITANGNVALTLADGREYAEKGKVEYVENAADETTDSILVYAVFPNGERVLKPGGTVVVNLTSQEPTSRASVPPNAVVMDMKGAYVWVVNAEGKAEKRYVVRGAVQGESQLIESGVRVGERVVADGVHKVRAGDKVVAAP